MAGLMRSPYITADMEPSGKKLNRNCSASISAILSHHCIEATYNQAATEAEKPLSQQLSTKFEDSQN